MATTGTDVERDGAGSEAVRVLHLDDDASFVELAARYLEREGDIEVETATEPSRALDVLESSPVDCVVSDFEMPEMDGLEFLRAVRERYPELPFLLLTGKGSEEIAGEAISAGVTDYLQKETGAEQFTVLANRIENTVSQRRAQQRAEANRSRVARVHERITDAVVAVDEDWRYTYVNGRAADLLGRDREALLGDRLWDSFPAALGTPFEETFREAMATQETRTVEEYYEPLDTWFEVRVYPDADGISIYFRDVTERKERERRFDAIFNQTFQFTGLLDPDGTLLEANETALEFGGLDREDVIGKKVWNAAWFQQGDADERAQAAVERARQGEFVRDEIEIQGAEGTAIIDFSVKPVTDERGEVDLLIPEGRDITERKRKERELREERAFTGSMLAALPDPLYAFDTEGNFLRWNDRLEAVTGYDGDEIAEMGPLDLVPDDEADEVTDSIQQVLEDGERIAVESYILTADGERLPYEVTGGLLTDEDGAPLGVVGIGRDISERRERERELEQQNERLEEFASVVSHDIQNHLSAATGSLSLVAEDHELADDEHFERARTALDRMGQLVDDVLDLAEQGRVVDDPEATDVRDLVSRCVETTGVDEGAVDLTVAVPEDREVLVDPSRFPELVENLLANAAEHAATDGEVTVEVGLDGDTLYVADDGPGLPEQKRDQVFDAGYTTSDDGTGFGLAIVEQIAEAHGWTVAVTESRWGGARFELRGVESP